MDLFIEVERSVKKLQKVFDIAEVLQHINKYYKTLVDIHLFKFCAARQLLNKTFFFKKTPFRVAAYYC